MKIYLYRVDNNESFEYYQWDYYYSSYIDAWNACMSYSNNYYKWKELNHRIYEVELDTNIIIILDSFCADMNEWHHGINKLVHEYIYSYNTETNNYNKIREINAAWRIHNVKHGGFRHSNIDIDSYNKRHIAIKCVKLYAYYRYKFDKFTECDINNIMNVNERRNAIKLMFDCEQFIKTYYNIPVSKWNKLIYAEYLNLVEDNS